MWRYRLPSGGVDSISHSTFVPTAPLPMRPVSLRVIPRPLPKSRVHFLAPAGVLLQGSANDAPSLVCGECGAVLVGGVPRCHFVDLSGPSSSPLDLSLRRVVFPVDDYVLASPLPLTGLVVVSDAAVVLTCPTCLTSNEIR